VAIIFSAIFVLFVFMLWSIEKLELVPTSFGAIATAMFAFLAFRFSKEKFRLDLFERRWSVYENTWKFCSLALTQGKLHADGKNDETIEKALDAADKSFRSEGHHRSQLLFGPDIAEVMAELNAIYARLRSRGQNCENKWIADMDYLEKTVDKLPEIFGPYLHFGDYKK
jgi:hypothetical protein